VLAELLAHLLVAHWARVGSMLVYGDHPLKAV
jgi:hypothetical protein